MAVYMDVWELLSSAISFLITGFLGDIQQRHKTDFNSLILVIDDGRRKGISQQHMVAVNGISLWQQYQEYDGYICVKMDG